MSDSRGLASWANAITAGRLMLSPLMFWVIPDDAAGSWVAFWMWFVFCASDGVDGYIARRRGPTAAGAFLDPLADKVLVLGAMFTLVSTDVFWIVPVAIIAAREFVISVYRVKVAGRGVSVPASKPSTPDTPNNNPTATGVMSPNKEGTIISLWAALVLMATGRA